MQNYTSVQLQKNFIRLGGRLRYNRDNSHAAGSSGSFNYNCAATTGCAPDPVTGLTFSYQSGLANQFSQTVVKNSVAASVFDVGIYAEDDWKVKPNLTFSFGIRYEAQNQINDKKDFAPRISFAYGLFASKGAPKTVVRGGFGIFYDRFNDRQCPDSAPAERDQPDQDDYQESRNGLHAFECECLQRRRHGNTTTVIGPALRTPYTMQYALGADQQLFRGATISVNYLRAQGVHQYNGQNINAPINGQYPLQPGLPVPQHTGNRHQSVPVGRYLQPEPGERELQRASCPVLQPDRLLRVEFCGCRYQRIRLKPYCGIQPSQRL